MNPYREAAEVIAPAVDRERERRPSRLRREVCAALGFTLAVVVLFLPLVGPLMILVGPSWWQWRWLRWLAGVGVREGDNW